MRDMIPKKLSIGIQFNIHSDWVKEIYKKFNHIDNSKSCLCYMLFYEDDWVNYNTRRRSRRR